MSTCTTIESDPEWEQVTGTPPSGTPTPPPRQTPAIVSSKEEAIQVEVVEAEGRPASISSPLPLASSSSSPSTITILSSKDVSTVLSTLTLSDFLTSQSSAFQAFSFSSSSSSPPSSSSPLQAPPRIALHLPNHTTLFMPSRASQVGGSACKIVSVPRSSDDTQGLPATTVVLDEQSGQVVGVVNAGELTGVRTAAGSTVVSRMLLGKGEGRRKLVVFGAGVQAFWHTHLHLLLFPSLTFVSFLARPSPSPSPSPRLLDLIARLQPLHPNVTFEHSSREGFDRGQAVHNADIIICCTPSQIPLFPPTQPRSGTHIVLIGSYKPFMLEVAPEMLSSRAGVVFVDGVEETRAEAGELQGYEGEVCEVGRVLGQLREGEGRERWERKGGDLTVFKSVGLAVQDVSITRLVFDKAKELGLGVETEF